VKGLLALGLATVLSILHAPSLEDTRTNRSDWSDRWNGLRFRVALPPECLEGEFFDFTLHLDFEASSDDEIYEFVRNHVDEVTQFELTNTDGVTTVHRPIMARGLPVMFRESLRLPGRVHDPPLPTLRGHVLLPLRGFQGFPGPGEYVVTPIYQNRGWADNSRVDSGPALPVWTGTIRGRPLSLRVRKGEPRTAVVDYFDAIELECRDDRWQWRLDPASRKSVRVESPPGHYVVFAWRVSRSGDAIATGISGRIPTEEITRFQSVDPRPPGLPCRNAAPDTLLVEQIYFAVLNVHGPRFVHPPRPGGPGELFRVVRTAITPATDEAVR
jgi:hypothetical protein